MQIEEVWKDIPDYNGRYRPVIQVGLEVLIEQFLKVMGVLKYIKEEYLKLLKQLEDIYM